MERINETYFLSAKVISYQQAGGRGLEEYVRIVLYVNTPFILDKNDGNMKLSKRQNFKIIPGVSYFLCKDFQDFEDI